MTPPIAITMGDAAGVGPELIVKLYRDEPELALGTFVAGDVQTLRKASAMLAQASGRIASPVVQLQTIGEVWRRPVNCIPVYQVGAPIAVVEPGQINACAGEFSGRCLFWAAYAAMGSELAAIVTAPIHKESLHAAGAPYNQFPGHTEMLQAAAASYLRIAIDEIPVRMMLANNALRVVLVSIHMSLRAAVNAVTFDSVLQTILIAHDAMAAHLGRPPKIAVAGLNPHAGEGGLFGHEEQEVILPAIVAARQRGCDVVGPEAPDTIFMRARRKVGQENGEFDVVVAMYHDQGLIPMKYMGIDQGVNITLGLPFVRTSPDHGTAFDIAGHGVANPASLIAALQMAKKLPIS